MKINKSRLQSEVKPIQDNDVVRWIDVKTLLAQAGVEYIGEVKGMCSDILTPIFNEDGTISNESYMIKVQHNLGTNQVHTEVCQEIDGTMWNVICDVAADDVDKDNVLWLVFSNYQTVNDIYKVRVFKV